MSKAFLDKNSPVFLNNRTASITTGLRQQKEECYTIIKFLKLKIAMKTVTLGNYLSFHYSLIK